MGVTGTVLKWLKSNVTERYQKVNFKNCIPETLLMYNAGTVAIFNLYE